MAFVLHILHGEDLFVDVGANIGAYTILASAVCGARVVAIEPGDKAFRVLSDNIALNRVGHLVKASKCALGREPGLKRLSVGKDTTNYVVPDQSAKEEANSSVLISVTTLDHLLVESTPSLIKIDVEGYESEVLAGGKSCLSSRALLAVIIELNSSGSRYGVRDEEVHQRLLDLRLVPVSYDGLSRQVEPLPTERTPRGTVLYAREIEELRRRSRSAARVMVGSRVV